MARKTSNCGASSCRSRHRWIFEGTLFARLEALPNVPCTSRHWTLEGIADFHRKIYVADPIEGTNRKTLVLRYPKQGEVPALDEAYIKAVSIAEWNAKFRVPPPATTRWDEHDWQRWYDSKIMPPEFDEWVKTYDLHDLPSFE